jgi:predicted kinase
MEAIILVGVQGAGKTLFYEQRFKGTHTHISRDVHGAAERAVLLATLAARRPLVLDNTNASTADRAKYIPLVRSFGYRVIGYFFDIDRRAAIARNNERAGDKKVPVPGILKTMKLLQPPAFAEGFDELFVVKPERNGEFEVKPQAK